MAEENSNKRCKLSIPNEELLALLVDFCNKLKGSASLASLATADFFKAARNFKTVFADTVASARSRGEGALDAMLGVRLYLYHFYESKLICFRLTKYHTSISVSTISALCQTR
jgi:hypothetical protein